jgi:hypothetical protein
MKKKLMKVPTVVGAAKHTRLIEPTTAKSLLCF